MTLLQSLRDHLEPIMATLEPVTPVDIPWTEALNLIAAEDMTAPAPFPPASVALRSGYAVNALDLTGASPQTPVPLVTIPAHVPAGAALPPGCDAILDPDALQVGRFGAEALDSPAPGASIRLQGQDFAQGARLVSAGETITAEVILTAGLIRVKSVPVRRPRVRLGVAPGPERDWLSTRLHAAGARLARDEEKADLILQTASDDRPRLALAPGEAGWAALVEGVPTIELPPRFDAMIGVWCALALPILARLCGTELAGTALPLARKVASSVGISELVLLRRDAGQVHPLSVGDAPLDRITAADAVAIVDHGSEGAPAGEPLTVISLDRPFGRARSAP